MVRGTAGGTVSATRVGRAKACEEGEGVTSRCVVVLAELVEHLHSRGLLYVRQKSRVMDGGKRTFSRCC